MPQVTVKMLLYIRVLKGLRGHIKVPDIDIKNLDIKHLSSCFKQHGDTILKYSHAMIVGRFNHAKEILNS